MIFVYASFFPLKEVILQKNTNLMSLYINFLLILDASSFLAGALLDVMKMSQL